MYRKSTVQSKECRVKKYVPLKALFIIIGLVLITCFPNKNRLYPRFKHHYILCFVIEEL